VESVADTVVILIDAASGSEATDYQAPGGGVKRGAERAQK
jgi:hypothetical protein